MEETRENEIQVVLLDHWCSDRDIAEAAWVSTGKAGQERPDADVERVVGDQIVPQEHVTPLEAVWMKFYLHIPIFVERQLDKSRMSIQKQDMTIEWQHGEFGRLGITQNELSLRYRTMRNTFYPLPEDIAARLEMMDIPSRDDGDHLYDGEFIAAGYHDHLDNAMKYYEESVRRMNEQVKAGKLAQVEMKRIREVIRGVLGASFYTDMQLTLNLNALKVMADKRLEKGHAQPETQWTVSLMVQEMIEKKVAPIALQGLIAKGNWDILTEPP